MAAPPLKHLVPEAGKTAFGIPKIMAFKSRMNVAASSVWVRRNLNPSTIEPRWPPWFAPAHDGGFSRSRQRPASPSAGDRVDQVDAARPEPER